MFNTIDLMVCQQNLIIENCKEYAMCLSILNKFIICCICVEK